jgi:hypothetical protein
MTTFAWKELVALGKPLAFPGWPSAQNQEEEAGEGERGPQDAELRADQNGLQVRLDDGVWLRATAYERAFQAGERVRVEEEWECSPEGAMAILQRELLLALQLSSIRTCGLPMYRAFLAQAAADGEEGEPGCERKAADTEPGSPTREGERVELTLVSYARLIRALDPNLYRVRWNPCSERNSCTIEVESLVSGSVFTYEQDAQVSELLAGLRAQETDEGEAAPAPRA